MFIRTSLSIVFLKCSASSVPVGHGGTNSLWPLRSPGGSGSFCFLRLSCQTACRLRLCRRPHATAAFVQPPFHFRFPCKFVSWRRRVPGAGGSLRGRVGRKRPAARAAERDEVRTPHPEESRGEGIRLQSPH